MSNYVKCHTQNMIKLAIKPIIRVFVSLKTLQQNKLQRFLQHINGSSGLLADFKYVIVS